MEGFMPSKVDEYLGLGNEGLKSVVLLTLGVGSKEDSNRTAPKVRKTLEEIVLKK
jgi:nitroreductase / dihydropteridine reductase